MNFFRFVFGKKNHVKLVEDHDFAAYLKRIGVFDDVVSGEHFCVSCGSRITMDNLQAIIPNEKGNVHFVCDKPSCLKQEHD